MRLYIYCLILLADLHGLACRAEYTTHYKADALFQLDELKILEVIVPHRDVAGAPSAPLGYVSPKRAPAGPEDYDIKLLKIRVSERLVTSEELKIVLTLTEINSEGEEATTLWWGHINNELPGMLIYGGEEDRPAPPFRSGRGGIEFPLAFTSPPTLSSNPEGLPSDIVNDAWYAIIYSMYETAEGNRVIEATCIETKEHLNETEAALLPTKHFDPGEMKIVEVPSSGTYAGYIYAREMQQWGEEADWLWKSMERYDRDGNLTMKCRVLENLPD